MTSPKYRPDIDGLRSLAILPVLLYHAGVPGFPGGFVGVDVFFVISGYLITLILVREIAEERYSVRSFYERRIRRIFPALLTVLAFVLAASPAFLLPSDFASIGRDAISALLFVANINFWRQSGYFAADAEAKPLLHMWSLGVEEQFYLIAPLALFLIFRYAPRYRILLVSVGLAVSLLACVYLTPLKPSASFYLLPTRAWELLAGSLLALIASGRTERSSEPATTLNNILGLTGLGLILFAVLSFTKATVFPGYAAVAPVAGACLLILSGQSSWTGRLLSSVPLVRIGLISYSLYLWHWPLIVFFRNWGWLETAGGKLIVIALSVAAAWLTWRFIESPTRDRRSFTGRRLASTVVASSLLIIVTSVTYASLNGWPSRYPASVIALDASRDNRSPDRERCHFEGGLPSLTTSCVLGGGEPSVAVWGDSHGVELAKAISEEGFSVREITYSSCPPAPTQPSKPDRPYCQEHNSRVFAYLSTETSIKSVVLVAFYGDKLAQSMDLQSRMADTANRLRAAGKQVIVVGPYMSLDGHTDVPSYLARGGQPIARLDSAAIDGFRRRMEPAAQVFLPTDLFCRAGECALTAGGSSLFFDAHHPSMHAARLVANKLAPQIKLTERSGPQGRDGSKIP